jgi:predicted nucleotidyltransferase
MVKKVSTWLFLEPLIYCQESLHLADISRKLGLPHATVRKHLNLFEKQGVVVKKIQGRLSMYKLNYSNPLISDFLQIIETERLIQKCQKDILFKEFVCFVNENFNVNNVIIFGSSVENVKKANDMDILVVGKEFPKENLVNLEKRLGIKFHVVSVKSFDEVTKALKNEIISRHIIIKGTEDVVRWMLKN